MLDGLLNRGFSFKCKSLTKASRSRIEVIRRRAEAKQRFLKEDLAKLLSNGLDINAYGRTEEYIAGMNLLSCYGFIEKSCEYIAKQLSRMQKQGECPEECRETVASLMFAAARFSDLPELRELRDAFQQKYGTGLDVFVNEKFVEILSSKTPASSKRIQVLQDIASEFQIRWDSRGFEQRMAAPPTVAKVDVQKSGIDTPRPVVQKEKNTYCYGEENALRREKSNHIAGKQETIEHYEKPQLKSSSHGDNEVKFRGRLQAENKYTYPTEKDSKESKEEGRSSSSYGKMLDNDHAGYTRQGKESKEERSSSFSHGIIMDNGHAGYTRHSKESKGERSSSSSHGIRWDNEHAGYTRHSKESKEERSSSSSHGLLDTGYAGYTRHSSGTRTPRTIENAEPFPSNRREHQGRTENATSTLGYANQDNTLKYMRKGPAEGSDRLQPSSNYALPPPYVASKDNIAAPPYSNPKEGEHRASTGGSKHRNFDVGRHYGDPSSSAKSSTGRILNELDHPDKNGHYVASPDNTLNSTRKHKEGSDRVKPSKYALPPPYVKSKDKTAVPPYIKPEENASRGPPKHAGTDVDMQFVNPFALKSNLVNSSGRSFHESKHPAHENLVDVPAPTKARTYGNEKDLHYQGDKIPLSKTRSSRRKHKKLSSSYDIESSSDDTGAVKRSSTSRRKDPSRKGLKMMFDEEHQQKDEEENMIDKLLIHYSTKPTSFDAGKLRVRNRGQPSDQVDIDVDRKREYVPHPTRSASLPNEHTASLESKKLTRVNTFQPDNPAKHVHPKLPDYDDLAARFTALKGR